MKPIGNTLTALVILILASASSIALGAVQASLDRDRVALGDTLQLTITATDNEDPGEANLAPLTSNFRLLQRSSSSNTSIVNGRLSQSRQLIIELTPIRQGKLQIPALQVGQSTTAAIPVTVGPQSEAHTEGATVLFEAEVDEETIYVQGQFILTLRVQQSINLERRSISELKLDNAFVKRLEQHSFQRNIDGRQWLVDEVRYAVFPEQSGTLEVPAQVFSGRITQGRRGFFDMGQSGQHVRRSTKPLSINVLPKPASFTAETWLPVRNLTLEETWSTPPDELRVGESATRSIRILGEGAQGAQLPPILFTPIDGLKYYPDQPQISEQEVPSGLLGVRQDSAAVVPTRAGSYLIPEVRIPWWDTQTKEVKYALLPGRSITVAAGEPVNTPVEEATHSPAIDITPATTITTTAAAPWQVKSLFWPALAAMSSLGWLLTLGYLWRQHRLRRPEETAEPDNSSEKKAFKQLLAAGMAGDATAVRGAVIDWAASMRPEAPPVSLEQVDRMFRDDELSRELKLLDSQLYSPEQDNWSGNSLTDCVRRLRSASHKANSQSAEHIRLYPENLGSR